MEMMMRMENESTADGSSEIYASDAQVKPVRQRRSGVQMSIFNATRRPEFASGFTTRQIADVTGESLSVLGNTLTLFKDRGLLTSGKDGNKITWTPTASPYNNIGSRKTAYRKAKRGRVAALTKVSAPVARVARTVPDGGPYSTGAIMRNISIAVARELMGELSRVLK